MQALESFHRHRYRGRFVDPRTYSRIRARITSAIPPDAPSDLRQALKKRLEFGYEHSLRRRLKELVADLPGSMAQRFARDYVERLVLTRNQLTHYPKRRSTAALSWNEMITATEQLKAVLYVLLLREIGTPAPVLEKLVDENRRFKHLLNTPVI